LALGSAVILSLQQPSGVFAGDAFGEIDARFLYCAVNALSLLGRLDALDREKTVGYIERCRNYDGGFGSCVGAESHAAMGACAFLSSVSNYVLRLNGVFFGGRSVCVRCGAGYFGPA
jgi:prenyltransferase beta subunit